MTWIISLAIALGLLIVLYLAFTSDAFAVILAIAFYITLIVGGLTVVVHVIIF